jgi:hypothetical protein
MLASCDQRTAAGRRDLAMLTLLARLGLRAGEVARLQLEDIDWRNGEIIIAGKGGRRDRLALRPMPAGRSPRGCKTGGPPGAGPLRVHPGPCPAVRAHRRRGHPGGGRGLAASRAGHHRRPPAAAHRGHADARRRRVAGRDRAGAAPCPPAHDGGVREGERRGPAEAGAAVAGTVIVTRLRASRWPATWTCVAAWGSACSGKTSCSASSSPGSKTAAPPRLPRQTH